MFMIKCGQKLLNDSLYCPRCQANNIISNKGIGFDSSVKKKIEFENSESEELTTKTDVEARKKYIIAVVCVFVAVIAIVTAVAFFVGYNDVQSNDDIVLTQQNQEIVQLIYNRRKTWERKSNGSVCQYCYFQKVQGELYFECAFNDSASVKYRIDGRYFYEDNYLMKDNNTVSYMYVQLLTPSMPNYDYSASDEEKYTYIENLVKELQDPQKWREIKEK